MKNYIQQGHVVTFIAGADILSGAGLMLGTNLFGVSTGDVTSGDEGEAQVEGVFELPKTSANTPAAFGPAYWNDTAKEVTTTASGNKLIGAFMEAYANGDVLCHVRLVAKA